MQAPDPIETVLARLMPPALRQDCQMQIEEMIDDLAGSEPANRVEISSGRWLVRCLIGGGIAAAIGALIAIFPLAGTSADKKPIATTLTVDRDLVLVKEAQLAEALRRSGPGEEIVISGIKDGKPLEMRMKLGGRPVLQNSPHTDDSLDTLPTIWRDKIQGFRESLDQALQSGGSPQREPRPRKDPLTPPQP